MSEKNREFYPPSQAKRLRRALRDDAIERDVGSAVCPFCKHLEARWRSAPIPESPGRVQVRVRCSQCQLSTTFELPTERRRWWPF